MIAALKQVEAGRNVEDLAREVGVSKHTLYGWKAKYGGMDVTEAQEAKQLRDENGAPGTLATKTKTSQGWGTRPVELNIMRNRAVPTGLRDPWIRLPRIHVRCGGRGIWCTRFGTRLKMAGEGLWFPRLGAKTRTRRTWGTQFCG
jgi:hypothetical protein